MSSARPYFVRASLATGLELTAACVALGFGTLAMLGLAGLLHMAATLFAVRAARRRRPDLSVTEKDIVFLTSLFVPIFGPAMSWSMPHLQAPEKVENAHEVFERYAAHVKPAVPDYERTLFTGDYERDLARELDAESYHEVLRHGSTDQKRNALKRLADLGEKRHFRLIRRCLLDPEHEVRLYAYSELERVGRIYEEEIGARSRQLAKVPGDPDALLAMSRAYFDYAASGVHDDEMAAFYFRSAEKFARQVQDSAEGIWLRAGALGRLHEYDEAQRILATLGPAEQALVNSCLARADLAFRRRDFAKARIELERIRAAGEEPPAWLAALEGKA